jgi:hypothetical protein
MNRLKNTCWTILYLILLRLYDDGKQSRYSRFDYGEILFPYRMKVLVGDNINNNTE